MTPYRRPPHHSGTPPKRLARLGLALALLAPTAALAQRKGAEALHDALNVAAPVSQSAPPRVFPASTAPIQIRIGRYYGWDRSFTLANGRVEAVIVPAIGRVMQFRFVGQSSPFWEDPALRGRQPDPASNEWINFGGDKTWPSPQADWPRITPRAWPPPVAFDSMAVQASVRRDAVVLTSPVDPHYGIRTERVISLDHEAPVMTIVTTYEKMEGNPVRAGVWIITQLEDPVGVFAPIPKTSVFPEGFDRQSGDVLPAGLKFDRNWLSLARDPAKSTKIGTDASRLVWVGETQMLVIDSPRIHGAEYPDHGSSAEVYTNPNPKTYVELEMLGPLATLAVGDRLSQTNTYTLLPRRNANPETDARNTLGLLP